MIGVISCANVRVVDILNIRTMVDILRFRIEGIICNMIRINSIHTTLYPSVTRSLAPFHWLLLLSLPEENTT